MIPWNDSVYGDITTPFAKDGVTLASAFPASIYSYFNGGSLDSIDRMTTLDNSIYLWNVNPSSAAATNSAFCTDNSNALNMVVSENIVDRAPLAMAWASRNQFAAQPCTRLAYNDLYLAGVYFNSANLFTDIKYNCFCACPKIMIYNPYYDDYTEKTISEISAYLAGADAQNAIIYGITLTLFSGGNNNRNTDGDYLPGGGSYARPTTDILTDRPIPPNAYAYIQNMHRDYFDGYHADWIDDKIYNPFLMSNRREWYGSDTSGDNYMTIGGHIRATISQIKSGLRWVNNDFGNITGMNIKFTDRVQTYDDVIYKWVVKCYNIDINAHIPNGENLTNYGNGNRCELYTTIEIIDDKGDAENAIRNAILHECANVGLYFTDTEARAQTAVLGTAGDGVGVYLPEFIQGENGSITTGNYFTGAEIQNVDYADADSVAPFAPPKSPFDDDGDFSTIINTGTIGAGVKYYALDNAQMNALCTWLNTTYEPTDEDEFIQDFKGTNPADYLTTVMFYPFDIPLSAGTDEQIVIGKLNAGGTTGRALDYTYGLEYDYGSFTIPQQGNFIDYMRKITVFVPFCGSVDLDPLLWTGRTLSVKMQVDFPTGVCTAFLYRSSDRGNGVFATLSGNIGVPLPLSAVANGSYQVAITNLLAAHKSAHRSMVMAAGGIAGGIGSAIVGAASGNLTVAAGGILSAAGGLASIDAGADKMENIDYNIDHTRATVNDVSGGSPFINCGTDFRVKILIITPQLSPEYNPEAYGKTTGFTCCKQGVLSEISQGFTQCAGADLSDIPCTATEKNMIFAALQSGVII